MLYCGDGNGKYSGLAFPFRKMVNKKCRISIFAVNFINVLHTRFSYKIFGAKISNPKASFVVFGTKISYKKCVQKTLMKLTIGVM